MRAHDWDAFLTGHVRTVYYFTGALLDHGSPAALIIERDGATRLISPVQEATAADECLPIETYSISRVVSDPYLEVAAVLRGVRAGTSWAIEMSYTPGSFVAALRAGSVHDAGPLLRPLRRRKEEDEIAEIRRSLSFSAVAYEAARTAIRPRLTEIDVYSAMLEAATRHAGHTLRLWGDFACGLRCVRGGGPPTPNVVNEGDLYILDLFPECAYYFGDTCRAFVVGEPSRQQQDAWQVVADTLAIAEQMVRPGLPARELYEAVRGRLAAHEFGASFWHHAGHGVGLHGHDSPRLIPGSDETIETGDVIAIEPALYSDTLRGGIRLENTYVVGDSGARSLFDYPLDL
jgi:Xaa-Pro aminopeptidase